MKVKDYITNTEHNINYESGVVVKIKDLEINSKHYHNMWACITGKTKKGQYIVRTERENGFEKLIVDKEYIPFIIGTKDLDCVNIGKERHKNEVVDFIIYTIKNDK